MRLETLTRVSLFVAMAVVIHFFESLITIPVAIPGFKLGLANIVGIFVLFYINYKEYCLVTFIRIFIVGLLFSGFGVGFLLSLSGGIFSFIITTLLYLIKKTSLFSVSVLSACFHALGQVCCYMLISMTTSIIIYYPFLAFLSMLSGLLLAFICKLVLDRMPKFKDTSKIKRKI